MTEHILRALGEIDERYFLAYAEKVKEKSPKKIVLRRWVSAAAAAALLIGWALLIFLPPQQKGIAKERYATYEEMISKTYGRMDTHFSVLNYDEYDKVSFFSYFDRSHAADIVEAAYYITLYQGTVKTEILYLPKTIHYEFNLIHFIPKITNAEEPYTETMEINHTIILYGQEEKRVFGEFEDETGFYKIICHSNQKTIFKSVVTDLLN